MPIFRFCSCSLWIHLNRLYLELVRQAAIIVILVCSSLIYCDIGFCIERMKLVKATAMVPAKTDRDTTGQAVEKANEKGFLEDWEEFVSADAIDFDAIHLECQNSAISFGLFT